MNNQQEKRKEEITLFDKLFISGISISVAIILLTTMLNTKKNSKELKSYTTDPTTIVSGDGYMKKLIK